MAKRNDDRLPLNELEQLLLAASDYVRASDDLRPRVLEAARAQRSEQRTRRVIRGFAGLLVVAATLSTSLRSEGDRYSAARSWASRLEAVDSQTIILRAQAMSVSSGGLGWGIVDAFRELRQDQADAIRSGL